MNTKSHLTLLLFGALAMTVHAADKPQPAPTVAVYDFTGDADAAGYGRKVTPLVTADLTTETNLALVERAELTKALSEQAFGISGLVSSEAAAQIGHITGAKILVAGQVMKIGQNQLVVVADIIGTETGRLFADTVEGTADNLLGLTDELSRKIAQTIRDQTTNLVAAPQETRRERLARIIEGITGTNRPSVSVNIQWWGGGKYHESNSANVNFGTILLQAGFVVVDATSDLKPDMEITGALRIEQGPKQGDLFSFTETMDLKVQERRTGKIIAIEHQAGSANDGALVTARAAAEVNTIDAVAERVLPLLAK